MIPRIAVEPRRITWWLSAVALALAALCMAGQVLRHVYGKEYVYGFVPMFWMDNENNIPTFFSTALLLYASLSLWLVGRSLRSAEQPWSRHWLFLAFVFMLLSLDEAASLHEMLIDPVQGAMGGTSGIFYFAWIVPALIVVAVVGICYLPFLRAAPARTRNLMLLAGALYVGGAVGFEMLEGLVLGDGGGPGMVLSTLVVLEETAEMLGVIVLGHAALTYLAAEHPTVQVELAAPRVS